MYDMFRMNVNVICPRFAPGSQQEEALPALNLPTEGIAEQYQRHRAKPRELLVQNLKTISYVPHTSRKLTQKKNKPVQVTTEGKLSTNSSVSLSGPLRSSGLNSGVDGPAPTHTLLLSSSSSSRWR